MSLTRKTLCAFLAVFAAALWMPTTGRADCVAQSVATIAPPDAPGAPPGTTHPIVTTTAPPNLNQEGLTERPLDILIFDNAVGQVCFVTGRQIVVTYNASLTTPNPVALNGSDLDVVDSAGSAGLVISVSTTVGLSTFNTPQTVITISVLQAGTPGNGIATATGAWVRLKNLRFDVTALAPGPKNLTATVTASNPTESAATTGTPATVGVTEPTIGESEGIENAPGVMGPGQGFQSTPTGLCVPAELDFSEGFGHAFRTAITSQAVYLDIPTGDTSLIFGVTGIPSGVTVTFPSSLANSVSGGGALVFTARSTTLSQTGGSFQVIYDTTTSGPGIGELTATTADTAATVGSTNKSDTLDMDELASHIGVSVGSSTGFGTADILVAFGPTPTQTISTGDDVQPNGIPRYTSNVGTHPPTRRIMSGPFFVIQPTQTVLLYPYATDTFGFQTGIEIANTGATSTAFGATGTCGSASQTGSLTFFFFPNTGSAFSFTPSSAVGRGLNTSGQLAAGNIFADSLDDLLKQAGQTSLVGNFDGYMIVVAQFNFGHGLGIVFNSAGATSNESALVLGPVGGPTQRIGVGNLPEGLHQ